MSLDRSMIERTQSPSSRRVSFSLPRKKNKYPFNPDENNQDVHDAIDEQSTDTFTDDEISERDYIEEFENSPQNDSFDESTHKKRWRIKLPWQNKSRKSSYSYSIHEDIPEESSDTEGKSPLVSDANQDVDSESSQSLRNDNEEKSSSESDIKPEDSEVQGIEKKRGIFSWFGSSKSKIINTADTSFDNELSKHDSKLTEIRETNEPEEIVDFSGSCESECDEVISKERLKESKNSNFSLKKSNLKIKKDMQKSHSQEDTRDFVKKSDENLILDVNPEYDFTSQNVTKLNEETNETKPETICSIPQSKRRSSASISRKTYNKVRDVAGAEYDRDEKMGKNEALKYDKRYRPNKMSKSKIDSSISSISENNILSSPSVHSPQQKKSRKYKKKHNSSLHKSSSEESIKILPSQSFESQSAKIEKNRRSKRKNMDKKIKTDDRLFSNKIHKNNVMIDAMAEVHESNISKTNDMSENRKINQEIKYKASDPEARDDNLIKVVHDTEQAKSTRKVKRSKKYQDELIVHSASILKDSNVEVLFSSSSIRIRRRSYEEMLNLIDKTMFDEDFDSANELPLTAQQKDKIVNVDKESIDTIIDNSNLYDETNIASESLKPPSVNLLCTKRPVEAPPLPPPSPSLVYTVSNFCQETPNPEIPRSTASVDIQVDNMTEVEHKGVQTAFGDDKEVFQEQKVAASPRNEPIMNISKYESFEQMEKHSKSNSEMLYENISQKEDTTKTLKSNYERLLDNDITKFPDKRGSSNTFHNLKNNTEYKKNLGVGRKSASHTAKFLYDKRRKMDIESRIDQDKYLYNLPVKNIRAILSMKNTNSVPPPLPQMPPTDYDPFSICENKDGLLNSQTSNSYNNMFGSSESESSVCNLNEPIYCNTPPDTKFNYQSRTGHSLKKYKENILPLFSQSGTEEEVPHVTDLTKENVRETTLQNVDARKQKDLDDTLEDDCLFGLPKKYECAYTPPSPTFARQTYKKLPPVSRKLNKRQVVKFRLPETVMSPVCEEEEDPENQFVFDQSVKTEKNDFINLESSQVQNACDARNVNLRKDNYSHPKTSSNDYESTQTYSQKSEIVTFHQPVNVHFRTDSDDEKKLHNMKSPKSSFSVSKSGEGFQHFGDNFLNSASSGQSEIHVEETSFKNYPRNRSGYFVNYLHPNKQESVLDPITVGRNTKQMKANASYIPNAKHKTSYLTRPNFIMASTPRPYSKSGYVQNNKSVPYFMVSHHSNVAEPYSSKGCFEETQNEVFPSSSSLNSFHDEVERIRITDESTDSDSSSTSSSSGTDSPPSLPNYSPPPPRWVSSHQREFCDGLIGTSRTTRAANRGSEHPHSIYENVLHSSLV